MEKKRDSDTSSYHIKEVTIKDINKINLDEIANYAFNILNLQPGVGKTTLAFNFLEKNAKTFYGTNRHAVIDEHIEKFGVKGVHHWEGFKRICINKRNKYLNKEFKVPAKFLCEYCLLKKECPYKAQFKKRTRIVAPLNYIKSNYVLKKIGSFLESKFDYYIIDEDFSEKFEEFRKPPERFNAYVWQSELRDALEKDDIKQIKKVMEYSEDEEENYKYWTYDDLDPVWVSYYNFIFDFNFLYQVPIILLDGTFHKDRFLWFLDRYKRLYKGDYYRPTIQIFNSDLKNKNTKIYVTPPHNRDYYKAELSPKKSTLLADAMSERNKISSIIGKKVPLITYMEYSSKHDLYFGGLSSSNLYENEEWIGILGLPFPSPKDFEKLCYQFFGRKISADKCEIVERMKNEGLKTKGIRRGYVSSYTTKDGEKLPIKFISYIFEDQLIQAFFRTRGLQHDRFILRYGFVPDEIKEVFTVNYFNDKEKLYMFLEKKYKQEKMDPREYLMFIKTASLKDIALAHGFYTPEGAKDLKEAKLLRERIIREDKLITDKDICDHKKEEALNIRMKIKITPVNKLARMMYMRESGAKKIKDYLINKTRA